MATGKIKWFDADKGYGFIARDDGQPDTFVHINDVEEALVADMAVTFDDAVDKKNGRPLARNVKVVGATVERRRA